MESLAANVARLKAYRARLIVFPRKGGKYKKADTSRDEISAAKDIATTRSIKAGLPIVNNEPGFREIKKRDIPAPVEGGAYRKLREARSEARLVGKREKRAKDKADEAAAARK